MPNPDLKDSKIKIEMLKEQIQKTTTVGSWKDRWVQHPLPRMAESNKAICWLTEHESFHDEVVLNGVPTKVVSDHVAWLYNKANLHGIDSFFQKVRRRITMLERSMHSSANAGRTWSGYATYNPSHVAKMLDIFRAVHNHIDVRKEKGVESTPATRLGLAKAPIDYKQVLYFDVQGQ